MSGILNIGKIQTLLDRLTSARATKLDNLDAAITSRLSGTDTRLNNLDAPISGIPASPIKSIQRGSRSTNASSGDANITISSVDMAKSVVISSAYTGYSLSSGAGHATMAAAWLSTSTNVKIEGPAYAHTSVTGESTIFWQVIEYV